MKRHYQLALAFLLLPTLSDQNLSYAGFELTSPGDPKRLWSANLVTTFEYDDNIFTREIKEQGSFKTVISPRLNLRIPLERTFTGIRYEYRATYFENRSSDSIDQSHLANAFIRHSFTPKLTLNIREIIRQGIEPELVELVDNVAIIERRRGDFFYNKFSSNLSYDITPIWGVSLSSNIYFWDFDDLATATGNDRTTLRISISTDVQIRPNTTTGLRYSFNQTNYKNSITDQNRGSDNHSVSVTWNQRYSPRLSINAGVGVQLQQFQSNESQIAPSIDTSLSYLYAPRSTLSAGLSFSIQNTEASQFRSADSLSLFLQANHLITPKLTTNLRLSGSVQNLQNAIIVTTPDTQEQSLQFQFSLSYAFQPWLNGSLRVIHTNLSSDITDRPFDRNRVSLSFTLTY